MSKFLLSVMMGASAVLATNTTACVETNGTSCGSSPAPPATGGNETTSAYTLTAEFTLGGMVLPGNETVATVGAAVPTGGKSVGTAETTTETGAAKVVFDIAYSTQAAVQKAFADTAATATVTAIGAARRRSLGEKSRRLTGDSMKVTYDAGFSTEDKRNAAVANVDSATADFQTEFAAKMGTDYGTITVTGMSVIAVAGGSCTTVDTCKTAGAPAADDDSSSGAATTFLSAAAAMVLAAFAF
jgi:hypothetical protein